MNKMEEEVKKALENMRPFLQADGGDLEFAGLSEDGIVKVRLTGACEICPMSPMTLRAGIERALQREVPGVRRVESVIFDRK